MGGVGGGYDVAFFSCEIISLQRLCCSQIVGPRCKKFTNTRRRGNTIIRQIKDTHQIIFHSGFRRTIAHAPELIGGDNKEMFDCCSRKAEGQVRRNLCGRTLDKCGLNVHWSRSLMSSGLTETERKEIIYGGRG